MSTNTLTSLAILKVNIDQGKDYLDYLRPFVLQVLLDYKPDRVTDDEVREYIRRRFGLEIPSPTIALVLKRLSGSHILRRESGIYRMTKDVPDPQLSARQAAAERHIAAVLDGLKKFSQDTNIPIPNEEEAVAAMSAFLSEFDIPCIRAYLRGTALPNVDEIHQTHIVQVSHYIQHTQRTDPERFGSLLVLVQGHMLANALMCPDLQNAPKTYRAVTFYLDTPLLVRRLGSEGETKQEAIRELIDLIVKLGGKVAAFSHSREELQNVLRGAAEYLESSEARGAIIFEARSRGTTKSDLLLLAESIDDELNKANIEVQRTPSYIDGFQIDETVFEQVLEDGISYRNPRAKEYDINSVRSIHAIRGDIPAPSVEKARAVFVTSNAAFARAAWEFGQKFESTKQVSSVITAFSLANMAWLKAPIGGPAIPTTQLLAFSYAALEPSNTLLTKYMAEVDRLQERGTITERDHQLLRSSPLVYPELMHLTLGEDSALTTETVTETLQRVSSEIKNEESERLIEEQRAHQETQNELEVQQARNQKIVGNLYWQCRKKARIFAWGVSVAVTAILAVALLFGLGPLPAPPVASWVIIGSVAILALATLSGFVAGYTIKDYHTWLENQALTWLLRRESKSVGVDMSDFSDK